MKKLFTLAIALLGFAGVANAATVDDLEVLKHSYVLVCDDLGARPGKGVLFGANHFLDVTGGSTATNKGQVDLSVVDGNEGYVTQEIVDKYGADYAGPHYNWLRLKNAQDVIAMKLTAGQVVRPFNEYSREATLLLGLLFCKVQRRSDAYICVMQEVTQQVFKATMFKNKFHDIYVEHNHPDDVRLGVSPHIAKITKYNGQKYQFGQASLSIEEIL